MVSRAMDSPGQARPLLTQSLTKRLGLPGHLQCLVASAPNTFGQVRAMPAQFDLESWASANDTCSIHEKIQFRFRALVYLDGKADATAGRVLPLLTYVKLCDPGAGTAADGQVYHCLLVLDGVHKMALPVSITGSAVCSRGHWAGKRRCDQQRGKV